jgi:hypothetical protein
MRYLDGPVPTDPAEARRVYHGPLLRTLRRLCGDQSGAWGELQVPPPSELRPQRPDALWRLPAALLDGCLVACGAYARRHLGQLSLPAGFARLHILRPPVPGQLCQLHLRLVDRKERFLHFDFTLRDAEGAPLLVAQGYRTVLITPEPDHEPDHAHAHAHQELNHD